MPHREQEEAPEVLARAREVRLGGIGCDPVQSCLLPSVTGSRSATSMRRFVSGSQNKGPLTCVFFRVHRQLGDRTTLADAALSILAGWHRRSDSWSSRPMIRIGPVASGRGSSVWSFGIVPTAKARVGRPAERVPPWACTSGERARAIACRFPTSGSRTWRPRWAASASWAAKSSTRANGGASAGTAREAPSASPWTCPRRPSAPMRVGMRVLGGALSVLGAVWILQGVGLLEGSFMTGQAFWLWMGVLALAGGLVLVFRRLRRS
jgi:hypothetical protein